MAKAIRCFRTAAHSDAEDIAQMAREELRSIERALGEHGAQTTLDEYLAQHRAFDKASSALRRGQFAVAVELFQRALANNAQQVQSHGNLALAYGGLGKKAEALKSLERALALDPDYEPAILNKAMISQAMVEGEPLSPEAMGETEHDSKYRAAGRSYLDEFLATQTAPPALSGGA